ncbi:MAG: hypothetical protein GY745_22545 [Actinomycetia bacterium]|nr:hypothetical protein [Actinomycetes bacterium]MCP3910782.1 hypothetical protein [Actinomycetes bacterium]MCP4087798.1 hypothetical protein [Actinomycetes bacterium]
MSKRTAPTTFRPGKTAISGRRRSSGGTGQLTLIENTGIDWRLDDYTRAVGRAGLAQARAALAAASTEPGSQTQAA